MGEKKKDKQNSKAIASGESPPKNHDPGAAKNRRLSGALAGYSSFLDRAWKPESAECLTGCSQLWNEGMVWSCQWVACGGIKQRRVGEEHLRQLAPICFERRANYGKGRFLWSCSCSHLSKIGRKGQMIFWPYLEPKVYYGGQGLYYRDNTK